MASRAKKTFTVLRNRKIHLNVNSTTSPTTSTNTSNNINHHHNNNPTPITTNNLNERFLEKLVTKLVRKDAVPFPRQYYKGQNINEHLRLVDKYLHVMEINDSSGKCAILFNSLEETVTTEVRAQNGAYLHEDDFEWLCDTLKTLYQEKTSETSPVMRLFSVKQKGDQSLNDFVNELRVEAYKVMPTLEDWKKEHLLTKAFLQGISDRQVAQAIDAMGPGSLEEVLKLAKDGIKCPHDPFVAQSENVRVVMAKDTSEENLQIKELSLQVKQLQYQLNQVMQYLKNLVGEPQNSTPPLRRSEQHTYANALKRNATIGQRAFPYYQPRPADPPQTAGLRNPIRCYNCNGQGHIARNCPLPNNRQNLRKEVYGPRNQQHLRQMQEMSAEDSMNDNWDNNKTQSDDVASECCDVNVLQTIYPKVQFSGKVKPKSRPTYCGTKKEETTAKIWSDFIQGVGPKPKRVTQYPQTLISGKHSEAAQNKPLVFGRCAGEKTKLFLDSGAETNVMDCDFLNHLLIQQCPVKFTPGISKIRCANGSIMTVTGYATLKLQIGNASANQKFMVVQGLFPKVIVGIRTMKTMGMILNTADDCAIVDGNVRVPFISRTVPQSITGTMKSGNA
jgi:hypothetical protein